MYQSKIEDEKRRAEEAEEMIKEMEEKEVRLWLLPTEHSCHLQSSSNHHLQLPPTQYNVVQLAG